MCFNPASSLVYQRRQAEEQHERWLEEQEQLLADQEQAAAELRAEQEAQQEQREREYLASQAGVRSLSVLASRDRKRVTAPTAALTGATRQLPGRRNSPTQTLRIGSSRQAPSVGLNIGL